jgi:hypothetical protein
VKFASVRAAGIFTLVQMGLPALVFSIYLRSASLAFGAIILCPIVFGAFWAGVRITGRPHTIGSLASAIFGTWTFNLASYQLIKLLFDGVSYADWVAGLLQLGFVFLVGCRSSPKKLILPRANGGDAAS